MPERFKGPVLKTGDGFPVRGFESRLVRFFAATRKKKEEEIDADAKNRAPRFKKNVGFARFRRVFVGFNGSETTRFFKVGATNGSIFPVNERVDDATSFRRSESNGDE